MDQSPSPHENKDKNAGENLPLPPNLYVGKATFDLFNKFFSRDYISGNPNLPEQVKHKNRRLAYILLAVAVCSLVALMILAKYTEI
jgi:hypothetical protein